METAGQAGQFGADAEQGILGATFWETDWVSHIRFERMRELGIFSNGKVASIGGKEGTFCFVPAPLGAAYAAWKLGWAKNLPIFSYRISPEILRHQLQCDIYYHLWKGELRISVRDKKIYVPDFFAHWLEIPWALNHFEAPGAMTVRWALHVEEENLREIVVIAHNGRVYLPKGF